MHHTGLKVPDSKCEAVRECLNRSGRRSNTTYGRRKLRRAALRYAKCSCFRKGTPARPSAGEAEPGSALLASSRRHVSQAEGAFSEEFLTYYFKVTQCNRKYPHDWASCICGHKGERANRRDLRIHSYLPIACEYAKQKLECPKGDACPKSHNLFEYWLHPKRYKTEMCLIRADCDRPVCFFAHNAEELRTLDPDLPPAELCWSAGAVLPGSSSSCGSREVRSSYSSRGWTQKPSTQQQYQHYQQQKLQVQIQQAQQVMLSQSQDMSLQQPQQQQQQLVQVSSAAPQQQPILVQMPSGELAMLAAVGQPLQPQQQLALEVAAQDHVMSLPVGGSAVVAHTQLLGRQGHMPAVHAAAAGQHASSVLGTFVPISSTAAAMAAGASQPGVWPQSLLDPLQQQQSSIYTNSSCLQPALQQQSMVAINSNACSPPSPLYQPTGNYTALVSSCAAAPHLPAGPVYAGAVQQQPLGTAASSMFTMTAARGAMSAGLTGYQMMQVQPDGLLGRIAAVDVNPNSGCSSAVGTGSYATQLGSMLAAPTDLPAPNQLTTAPMYSQAAAGSSQGVGVSRGGVVISPVGSASQGFGVVPISGVDMHALQGALQGLQI